MSTLSPHFTLDTSGKSCPMPMIETNLSIKKIQSGEILEVIATDVGTKKDIPSWCQRKGHTLLESHINQNPLRYLVQKGEDENE